MKISGATRRSWSAVLLIVAFVALMLKAPRQPAVWHTASRTLSITVT